MAYYGQNPYGGSQGPPQEWQDGSWGSNQHNLHNYDNMAFPGQPAGAPPGFNQGPQYDFSQPPPPPFDQQYQAPPAQPTYSGSGYVNGSNYAQSQNYAPAPHQSSAPPLPAAPPPPPPALPQTRYCDTCDVTLRDENEYRDHMQSSQHYDSVLKKIQLDDKGKSRSGRTRERELAGKERYRDSPKSSQYRDSPERERQESKYRAMPAVREHVEKGLAYDPDICAGKCTICPKMEGVYDRAAWETHTTSKKHRRMLIPYLMFLSLDGFSYQYGSHLIPPRGAYEDTELENLVAGKKSETVSAIPRYLTPKQKARWGVYLLKIARQYNLKCVICGNTSSTYATFYAHVVGKKHALEVISKLAVMGSIDYRQRYGHLPGPNTVHLGEEEVDMIPDSILPGEQDFVDVDHPPRSRDGDESREMDKLDEAPPRRPSPLPSRSSLPMAEDPIKKLQRTAEAMLKNKGSSTVLTDILSNLVKQIQDKPGTSYGHERKERSRKHKDSTHDDMDLDSGDDWSSRKSRQSRRDVDERRSRQDSDSRRSYDEDRYKSRHDVDSRRSYERDSQQSYGMDEPKSRRSERVPWESDHEHHSRDRSPRRSATRDSWEAKRSRTPQASPPRHQLEDRFYATSRFTGLIVPAGIELVTVPDASLDDLVAKAIEWDRPHRAYFMFGEVEMTRQDTKTDYKEMVMAGHPNKVVEKVVVKMRETIATLSKHNIQAIFSDIVPVSFHNWNFRFAPFQGRPYNAMQAEYNQAVVAINEIILAVNSRRKLHGPMLASFILRKTDGKLQLNENKLLDGITPAGNIRQVWAGYISRVILMNRETESGARMFDSSDTGPPEYLISEVEKPEASSAPETAHYMEVEPSYPTDHHEGKRKHDHDQYERERKQQRLDDEAAEWWSSEYPQAEVTEGEWVGGYADDEEERLPFRLINDLMPLHDARHEGNQDSPHLLDRIYGTDRASGLNIPRGIDVETIPGAKLEALVERALEYGQPHTAYFICGVPDLTHAPVDKPTYREVTVPRMSIDELTDIYVTTLRGVSARLWQYDIRPVFAPPVAMDIAAFNAFLLNEGVTTTQYHMRNYGPMQDMLNKVVMNLLHKVKEINQENQVYTPRLETIVMKVDARDHSTIRFNFDQLVDGLHLSDQAKMIWSTTMRRSLIANRRILLGTSPTAARDISEPRGEYVFGSSMMPVLDERFGMPDNMHPLITEEWTSGLLNCDHPATVSALMAVINNLEPDLFRVIVQPNVNVLITRLQKIFDALRDPDADHIAASQDLQAIIDQPHFVHPPVQTLLWKLGFGPFFHKLVPDHARIAILRGHSFSHEAEQKPVPLCHICKQLGHPARSCPSLANNCYRCNEPGHKSRNCPRLREEKRDKKCFRCLKTGHLSYACKEVVCIKCKEVGHIYDDCPEKRDKNRKDGKKCGKCKSSSHSEQDCPEKKDKKTKEKRCDKCKKSGHVEADCPGANRKPTDKKCDNCKKVGHLRADCPERRKTGKTCDICNRVGHLKADCPEKQVKKVTDKKCDNCRKVGHLKADCPEKKESKGDKKCGNCQKVGHLMADCPERQVEKPTGDMCYKCGEVGHIRAECRAKKCDLCGIIGHIKRNCPERGGAARKCEFCSSTDHLSADCPAMEGEPEQPKVLKCQKCQSLGHSADDCQKYKTVLCSFWPDCRKGDDCPFIHPTKKCRFWPGDCKRGDSCMFIHERMPEPPAPEPKNRSQCKFWGTPGGCREGERCRFVHEVHNPPVRPCKFWPGDCRRGMSCPWPHPGFY